MDELRTPPIVNIVVRDPHEATVERLRAAAAAIDAAVALSREGEQPVIRLSIDAAIDLVLILARAASLLEPSEE